MKKILMALTLVGLVQVSAEAQSNCSCKTKHHYTHHAVVHHHFAYKHMRKMHPVVYRPLTQRTADQMAINTSTHAPAPLESKAKNNLVPDNLSAIGTPTVYNEPKRYNDQNGYRDNVTLAPTSSRRSMRATPCRSINYAANNRVRSYAGYRRHNIIVNDDMNNPYQGEPSKQNDGVRKNEHRNLNAYQTGMVLPGSDGSRP